MGFGSGGSGEFGGRDRERSMERTGQEREQDVRGPTPKSQQIGRAHV